MDIIPDDVKISLPQRTFAIASSPKSTGSSASSSPGWSNFSFDCQPSKRSATSSTTSLEGENGQSEEDVAYFSDADSHFVPAGSLKGGLTSGQSGVIPVTAPENDDTVKKAYLSHVGDCPVPPLNRRTVRLRHQAQDDVTACPVPLSSRQNPRRTQRQSDGSQSRPPPQLIRQSERKDIFVDSLVGELERIDKFCGLMLTASAMIDTTTQTIETIWPLSVAQGSSSADQNLIDLRTFVQAVLKRSKTSYSSLVVAIYYLVLVMPALPKHDFTMPQSIDSFSCRAMQCGRRMFLAALILASKYLQDRNYSTRAWGKISGLKAVEINANERVFLKAVNWKLHVPESLFQRWERIVLRYTPSDPSAIAPRSSPAQNWRTIFRHLNAELDQFDTNGTLISDNDSGYYSESSAGSSRGTSPHGARDLSTTPVQMDFVETGTVPPPLPELPPLVMEPTPLESRTDHRMLPPLQPREGPLPTPQITPQIRNFCAPAVSASGLLPRRSSMSIAMAEHRKCLGEQILDRPCSWGPTSDSSSQRPFNRAPSSLSISSTSSDLFMSDVSRYPSRSSSISSVASSNCALPEPDLASEAVRRCASMKMSAVMDKYRPSHPREVTDAAAFARFPVSPSSFGEDFYFKERPKAPRGETLQNAKREDLSPDRKLESDSNDSTSRHAEKPMKLVAGLTPDMNTQNDTRLSDDDEDSTPKPKPAKIATPTSQTYQAAAALVDLTLDRNSILKPLKQTPRANSLKRGRTLSSNRGLQSATQTLIRQHSLSDANSDDNPDAIVIIPDEAVADSWLLKSNQGLNNELWADFHRRQIDSEDASQNREVARQLMEQHTQESFQSASDAFELQPRKKTCCHSSRNPNKHGQRPKSCRKGSEATTPTQSCGNAKTVRKTSGSTKIRGPRKPDAALLQMCRDAPAEYAELQTIKVLLYGEVPSN